MFSFLLDIYLKSKTAGSHDNSLQPWKSYKVGFQSGCTSYIPASSVVRLQFLFLLATTVLSFDNILPCEYEVSRLKSVVCNSPSIGSYANQAPHRYLKSLVNLSTTSALTAKAELPVSKRTCILSHFSKKAPHFQLLTAPQPLISDSSWEGKKPKISFCENLLALRRKKKFNDFLQFVVFKTNVLKTFTFKTNDLKTEQNKVIPKNSIFILGRMNNFPNEKSISNGLRKRWRTGNWELPWKVWNIWLL